MNRARRDQGDIALALALALVLSLIWTLRDWTALSALRLPDTDDVMRLQQVRDWLNGQGFSDLKQVRLGRDGLEMHWSRLADLGLAGVIVILRPVLGGPGAELAAVILWPAMLFATALALVAGVARRLGTCARTAIVVAAIAYPASSLFMPGRIDHHGLQLVLLLIAVRATLGGGGWRDGVAAGAATTASLVIGMESAPFLAVAGAVAVVRWISSGAPDQLLAYGATLIVTLGGAAWLFATSSWTVASCDAFAAPLWRGAMLGACAPLAMALLGHRVPRVGQRRAVALGIGAVAMGAVVAVSPACLSPYGNVDPMLARLWLAQVAEAQPLLRAPLGDAWGYAGLALVGLAATLWQLWRGWGTGQRGNWLTLALFQLGAVAVMLVQLRGVYLATLLAAPALAGVIQWARGRGTLALVAAWSVSAGMLYPLVGSALMIPFAQTPTGGAVAQCDGARVVDELVRLPPGVVAAPVDVGAHVLAATSHRVLAAPYHRNADGNLAVYGLMQAPVADAHGIARALNLRYLADCSGGWAELGSPPRGSLLAALRSDAAPHWLRPVARTDHVVIYEVEGEMQRVPGQ